MKGAFVFPLMLTLYLTVSCSDNSDIDTSDIILDNTLVRFDSLFYESGYDAALKEAYPAMFPEGVSDSIWLAKSKDHDDIQVYKQSKVVFSDFSATHLQVQELLKRAKYYFPEFKAPDIYTILSDFDFEYPVLYAKDRIFISLDMYLGADSEFYSDFPEYIRYNFRKDRIPVDIAESIARAIVPYDRSKNTLLDRMVYEGKVKYLQSLLLGPVDPDLLMGYTPEKYNWTVANEAEIWSYFISNKFLYSTDNQLVQRFIDRAPFSKFYLNLDRSSPGQVAVFLGYRIVQFYANNNNIKIQELISFGNSQEFLKKSKYKPSK